MDTTWPSAHDARLERLMSATVRAALSDDRAEVSPEVRTLVRDTLRSFRAGTSRPRGRFRRPRKVNRRWLRGRWR